MDRNRSIPLYMWIKSCGTILKVNEHSLMRYGLQGNTTVRNIAIRYVKLHKPTVAQFAYNIGRLISRYNTRWHHLGQDINQAATCRDQSAIVQLEIDQYWSRFYTDETDAFKQREDKLRRAELREKRTNMIKRAEEDPIAVPEMVVVNRLTDTWTQNYSRVGEVIPDVLKGIEGIHEIPAGHPPGVYILLHNDEVVYVGQSVNPSTRIGQHTQDKIFDKAFLIPTNDLDAVEMKYINMFKPKYNKRLY